MALTVLDFSFTNANDNASILTGAGDTLVLLPGFNMVSNGTSPSAGTLLANTGQIYFLDGGAYGSVGVRANFSTTINIGETGRAFGAAFGILVDDSAGLTTISNAGQISSKTTGVYVGTDTFRMANSGVISGAFGVGTDGQLTLQNDGTIEGTVYGVDSDERRCNNFQHRNYQRCLCRNQLRGQWRKLYRERRSVDGRHSSGCRDRSAGQFKRDRVGPNIHGGR